MFERMMQVRKLWAIAVEGVEPHEFGCGASTSGNERE